MTQTGHGSSVRHAVTLAELARIARLAPSRAIDSNGDSNSSDHQPAAATGDSA